MAIRGKLAHIIERPTCQLCPPNTTPPNSSVNCAASSVTSRLSRNAALQDSNLSISCRSASDRHISRRSCDTFPVVYDGRQWGGEGPRSASIMLVGEQRRDAEDLQARLFVSPAGALLDKALEEAGVERCEVCVTNAVKHF